MECAHFLCYGGSFYDLLPVHFTTIFQDNFINTVGIKGVIEEKPWQKTFSVPLMFIVQTPLKFSTCIEYILEFGWVRQVMCLTLTNILEQSKQLTFKPNANRGCPTWLAIQSHLSSLCGDSSCNIRSAAAQQSKSVIWNFFLYITG